MTGFMAHQPGGGSFGGPLLGHGDDAVTSEGFGGDTPEPFFNLETEWSPYLSAWRSWR